MAKIGGNDGDFTAAPLQGCSMRSDVRLIKRTKPVKVQRGWETIGRAICGAHLPVINEKEWHALGESNPSFQNENLTS